MASASDSTRLPAPHGPVTHAIWAIRTEPEPPRRDLLKAAGAALVGVIMGSPIARASPIDINLVAEEFLRDAAEVGLIFVIGPDCQVWRTTPFGDARERHEARERLLFKVNNRPRLMRAVHAAVRGGFRT